MIRDALKEISAKVGCIKYLEVSRPLKASYIRFIEKNDLQGACATSMIGRSYQGPNTVYVTNSCQVSLRFSSHSTKLKVSLISRR